MADNKTYIKGNAVDNATSYELAEKNADGTYTTITTKDVIDFEISALSLAEGDHIFAVKAKADGYEDSDYSNEVVYTVEGAPAAWEIYSQDGVATISEVDGVPTISCTQHKALAAILKTNSNFSYVMPTSTTAQGQYMIVVGRYGTTLIAIRPRGEGTGTNLQRYDYSTFNGGVLSTDANATSVIEGGSTIRVSWTGNTVSIYDDGVLQSSFDCSTHIANEGWSKCAGWLTTYSHATSFTLSNFTLE